jgi:hypothetical protein
VTLLYVLSGAIALIVLALAVPVEIEFSAAIHGRVVAQTRFKLLFGLISFAVNGGAGRKERRGTGAKGPPFLEKLFNAAQAEGIGARSWALVKRLVSCIKVRRLATDLTVSLGDDYYTGMLAGLAIPLVLFLDRRFGGRISLRPAFEEDLLLEGDLLAAFSLQPLKIVVPCLVFACSPQFRRVRRILSGGR